MSDPKQQRADGCSIFFSLILAAVIISAFHFIPKIFTTAPPPVSEDLSKQRQQKIDAYKIESEKFEDAVNSFHSENNSSIDSVMQKVVEDYESNKTSDY